MAGANGIPKFALWNREDQFQSLQTYGTIFNEANLNLVGGVPTNTFPLAAITAAQLMSDWVITAATPVALTAPANTALNTLFEQLSKYEIGNSFTVTITNTDAVPHNITFGAGYTVAPNPLIIPPMSKGTITIQLIGIPCLFQVTEFNFGTSGGAVFTLPGGAAVGDLLEWNGTSWQPSSTINNTDPALLNRIQSFPNVNFNTSIETGLKVNIPPPFIPGGVSRGFLPSPDSILYVSVPTFTAATNNLNGVLVDNQHIYLSSIVPGQNPDANVRSNFVGAAGFAVCPAMNSLWHYYAFTNGGPGGGIYGLDIGGQFFGVAFNVLSDSAHKKNIEPVKLDSRSLRDFKVSKYHLKTQADNESKHLGLIADEVAKLLPSAVSDSNGTTASHLDIVSVLSAVLGYAQDLESRLSSAEQLLQSVLKTPPAVAPIKTVTV